MTILRAFVRLIVYFWVAVLALILGAVAALYVFMESS